MCKTPKDAVIPVGSCLELTTQRARHSNSLGTHTNEFNYRYHEHRPLRLWITLGNSGMPAERKPGVCNEFCHVYSLGLSSFTEGLQCSLSGSQLPGTHMNAMITVRKGERRMPSEFPPREWKQITRDIFSQGTSQHWESIPTDRTSSDKWSPRSWADHGPGKRLTHLVLHINLHATHKETRATAGMCLYPIPFFEWPRPFGQ